MSVFSPDSFIVADVAPSPNFDERKDGRSPDMILLHYTGMQTGEAALKQLTSPASKVSCHYVVFENGRIVQCVPEEKRAWHAGESSWAGETDINSRSIGVEIVNPGHEFGYKDFPLRQIAAVISLCKSIITRRGPISADRILAHSDVAPARKQDPGEKFPWGLLSESGIGHW
ncbi:MAG: N-acetylmuramoyl-L-alanine amidase, partial [Pseudolabrys sp.]